MIRRTSIRKRRPGTRKGQLTAAEITAVRLKVYERAEGRCELQLLPGCIAGILPWTGETPWDHGHLVHLRARSIGGLWTLENLRWGCYFCHLFAMHVLGMKAA